MELKTYNNSLLLVKSTLLLGSYTNDFVIICSKEQGQYVLNMSFENWFAAVESLPK